jgi:hypothetical protein
MCLGPKEAVFEKPEESSQHLKAIVHSGPYQREADLQDAH